MLWDVVIAGKIPHGTLMGQRLVGRTFEDALSQANEADRMLMRKRQEQPDRGWKYMKVYLEVSLRQEVA
jgi:hypothetical protein